MGEEEVYKAVYTADAEKLVSESRKAAKSQKGLERAMSDSAAQAQKSSRRLTAYAKTLGDVGGRITRFGAIATAAAGGIIAQSLRASASVEEMASRFRVTFKGMSDQTERWAADYAAQIGRSRFAMMRMAADYKVLLTAFGLQQEEATQAAMSLVKLTSDWESFLDVPAAEVMAKISSGLAGEAEALRKVGVLISEADVRQRGLNEGMVRGKEEIDGLTKVKLRLKIILDGLKEAQGDATRTALDLTNQWRALRGALEELNVELGRVFVDSAKGGVKALADLVRNSAKWIKDNKLLVKEMGASILKTGLFAIALGKLIQLGAGVLKLHAALSLVGPAVSLVSTAQLGLIGAVAGASVAIGNWIGEATGMHTLLGQLFYATGKWLGVMDKTTAAIRKGEEAEREVARLRKTALAAAKEREEAARKASQATLDAATSARKFHTSATAAAAAYGKEIIAIGIKLSALKTRYEELDAAQREFAETAEEMLFDISLRGLTEAERAMAEYGRTTREMQGLLPSVLEGNIAALDEFRNLFTESVSDADNLVAAWAAAPDRIAGFVDELADAFGQSEEESRAWLLAASEDIEALPVETISKLAEAWGIGFDKAKERLGEVASASKDAEARLVDYVKGTAETIDQAIEMQKDGVEDSVTAMQKRLAQLEEWIARLNSLMKDMEPTVDTAAFDKATMSMLKRVWELRDAIRELPAFRLAGGGPGAGSPGLDRLSTAKVAPSGRSGGNVVNVNATIPITRAEPVTAMAKAVASEIGRMRRRGQVKW